MRRLNEFYGLAKLIIPDKEIGIYNSKNELILSSNNICDCDEIVEKYGNTINYNYDESKYRVDIILCEV